ncbi:hypothetical protein [Gordonia polyisoprenivorans]|uniref:hypothetical protein n=1 Tax=Gordonia polyisoprenivorans TaxID=84595 RepID=UPI001FCA649C|nr:hypothetical protein [Gordonia polyisoprenivorans]
MSELGVITTVVIDVLGTLVDEPGGLTTAIAEAVGDKQDAAELLAVWQEHIEEQQQRILRGLRDYVNSDQLDAEAAGLVMDRADFTDPARRDRLAASPPRRDVFVRGQMLRPESTDWRSTSLCWRCRIRASRRWKN